MLLLSSLLCVGRAHACHFAFPSHNLFCLQGTWLITPEADPETRTWIQSPLLPSPSVSPIPYWIKNHPVPLPLQQGITFDSHLPLCLGSHVACAMEPCSHQSTLPVHPKSCCKQLHLFKAFFFFNLREDHAGQARSVPGSSSSQPASLPFCSVTPRHALHCTDSQRCAKGLSSRCTTANV